MVVAVLLSCLLACLPCLPCLPALPASLACLPVAGAVAGAVRGVVHPIALTDNFHSHSHTHTHSHSHSHTHSHRHSEGVQPIARGEVPNSNPVVCRFKKYDLNSINSRLLLGNQLLSLIIVNDNKPDNVHTLTMI